MRTEDAVRLNHYAHIAAITLLYYDWLVTLPAEIAHVWRRPLGASSGWFLLNRYLSVLGNVAVSVVQLAPLPKAACGSAVLFHQILLIGAQVVVCIILTIRTYALYNKSPRILALILSFQLALFGISVWAVATQSSISSTLVEGTGCMWGTSRNSAWRIAVAWESLFTIDCLLFLLTVLRGGRPGKGWWGASRSGRRDLLGVVRRDGAMYFGTMALANLGNLVTFYLREPLLRGVLSTFASAVSVTLAARLVLNLHASASPPFPSARGNVRSASAARARATAPVGIFTTQLEVEDAEVLRSPRTPRAGEGVWEYEMGKGGGVGVEELGVEELGKERRWSEGDKDMDGRFGRQWGRASSD